jgi:hypothetical protein
MSGRTLVGFAGASIDVVRLDAGATALADFLFRQFAVGAAAAPCLRLDLAEDGPSTFSLWRDGAPVYRHTPAAQAARLLLAEAVHQLAIACSDGIVFHAAAVVALENRGILLPGRSGAGKSTLAAWADHRGFPCLGDEMIAVAEGARLIAFPRPICLQTDARDVLPEAVQQARRDGRLLEAEDAILLAPRTPVPSTPVALARIVFPRYDPSATTSLQPLSRAESGLRLMGSLVSAHGAPEHRFHAVADLARRVPAFELAYGRLDGATETLLSEASSSR